MENLSKLEYTLAVEYTIHLSNAWVEDFLSNCRKILNKIYIIHMIQNHSYNVISTT